MTPWILLLLIAAVALLYVVLPIMADAFARHRPAQLVRCPETGETVRVQLDATLAALTAVPGPSKRRVAQCTRWPERQDCAQECVRAPA
jgi:hypothetical protein